MDETTKGTDIERRRRFLIILAGSLVAVAVIVFMVLIFFMPQKENKPKRQNPIHADTVTYQVRAGVADYERDPDSGNFLFYFRTSPRTQEEISACLDYTTQIERKEPPYAWTGCYGDLSFPYAHWYMDPSKMEIEVSSYPGVKVYYEAGTTDSLRIVEAGKTVFSVKYAKNISFLDMNEDDFPEILVETSGIGDEDNRHSFFVYDFFHRESYSYRSTRYTLYSDREYDDVMIWRRDFDGTDCECRFTLKDENLVLVERSAISEEEYAKIPCPEEDPGEPFCWFDLDKGDPCIRREIRLPEYPNTYFVAEKTYLSLYFKDEGKWERICDDMPISVYFADNDGDGKRELFVSKTSYHQDRFLKHYDLGKALDSETTKTDSQTIFGDNSFAGVVSVEDVFYYAEAEYVLEDGMLRIQMRDPGSLKGDTISEEIVNLMDIHHFPKSEYQYYYDSDGKAKEILKPLRLVERGVSFKQDRQGLVVLAEYPELLIYANQGVVYSSETTVIEFSGDTYQTVFADLDGDGMREMCVNLTTVIDIRTGSVLAELEPGYRFVWHEDDLWVAEGERAKYVSQIPGLLIGKPVLKNGKIEIVSGK